MGLQQWNGDLLVCAGLGQLYVICFLEARKREHAFLRLIKTQLLFMDK